jgi:hypothetical protein
MYIEFSKEDFKQLNIIADEHGVSLKALITHTMKNLIEKTEDNPTKKDKTYASGTIC